MDIQHSDYCETDHTAEECVEEQRQAHMGLANADPVWVASL